MSPVWTLRDANGVEKALGDWSLGELVRERINQKPDEVTFRAGGAGSDADPLFAHGSTVQLFRNGTGWFYGRVVSVPGRASARGEEQVYRVAGSLVVPGESGFPADMAGDGRGGRDVDSREQEPVDPGAKGGRDEADDGRGDRGGAGLCGGARDTADGRDDFAGTRWPRMRRRWICRARR